MKGHDCAVVRRMLITHGTIQLGTGKTTTGRKEWVTRECGTPLFSEEERRTETCRSCAGGWKSPLNYPANEPQPTAEVEGA